jgi:hypothetical protein
MFWMIVEFAYNNSRAPSSVEDINYCTVKVVRTPSLVSCLLKEQLRDNNAICCVMWLATCVVISSARYLGGSMVFIHVSDLWQSLNVKLFPEISCCRSNMYLLLVQFQTKSVNRFATNNYKDNQVAAASDVTAHLLTVAPTLNLKTSRLCHVIMLRILFILQPRKSN